VLTNSFYRSGDIINKIPITDMSSMHKLFDDGIISYKSINGEFVQKKLREGEHVSELNLKNHLFNPYFLNEDIDKSFKQLYFRKINGILIGIDVQ